MLHTYVELVDVHFFDGLRGAGRRKDNMEERGRESAEPRRTECTTQLLTALRGGGVMKRRLGAEPSSSGIAMGPLNVQALGQVGSLITRSR